MRRELKETWKKGLSVLCAVSLTVAGVAGCGSAKTTGETAATTTAALTNEAVAEGPVVNQKDSENKTAVKREVINVGIEADPGDLSPWGPNNTGRTATSDCIYENLAHCIDGEIHGVLMKDYELAEDESHMTVHIYDNIYDSAGNHMTASDVKFSFEKCVEMGNIYGLSYIENVEVIDDYTVQFNFNTTLYVYDLETLFETFYVVTEAAYEASPDGMAATPVSTSPYKVTDYVSGYILTLEKTDSYWQTDESLINPRDRANVDKINYYIITESSQMTTALENGSIDMSWAVRTDDLPSFQEGGAKAGDFWVYQVPDNLVSQIFCNCSEDKLTSNADLRKAIYYAIDANMILQSVYNGNGIVTHDVARPKCPDYADEWANEDNYYNFNLEKAKEHMAASGYKEGEVTLSLMCEATDAMSDTAVLIQALLEQIGVKVDINSVESSLLSTYQKDPTAWDLLIISKAASNYVTTCWKNCFSQTYFTWGGTINFAYDDELQKRIDAARLLSSHTDETVQAAHDYIIDMAYGHGLINYYNNLIIPKSCSEVVLSYKNAIMPGACTYTE